MKNQLVQLLESFDKRELKRFKQFITCENFNTDIRLLHLTNALEQHVLNKAPFETSMQAKIYQLIFADIDSIGNKINGEQKNKLGVRLSNLLRLAERFLMIEALPTEPGCEIRLISKKLMEKSQFTHLDRFMRKRESKANQLPASSLAYYSLAFEIEKSRMIFLEKDFLRGADNLSVLNQQLDMFYLIWKLRLQNTMKSVVANVPEKSFDFSSMEAMTNLLDLPIYKNNPNIIINKVVLQLMDTNEETYFFQLLPLLEQYEKEFSKTELSSFYTAACNFCSLQIRKGQVVYIRKSLDIYKLLDEKDLLIEGGVLQIQKIFNIVNLSCNLKEFDYAEKTLIKYLPFIQSKHQQSILHSNQGMIQFYQGNYNKAFSHLAKVENLGDPYDWIYKNLLLKSCYEKDQAEDSRTLRIFYSTQKFIKEYKSISSIRRQGLKHFIQILIALYKVKHYPNRKKLAKISNKLNSMEVISNKDWLLKKTAELGSLFQKA